MPDIGQSSLTDALWKISLQAGILTTVVWVVTRLARNAPARLRHALWALVLIKFLIPPFAHFPAEYAVWRKPAAEVTPATAQLASSPSVPQRVGDSMSPELGLGQHVPVHQVSAPTQSSPAKMFAQIDWSLDIWALGAGVMLLILLTRRSRQRRLVRSSLPADDGLLEAMRNGATRLRVRGLPGLRISEDVSTPMLVGLFNQIILLPGEINSSCGDADLQAMLLHELAHVKRRDMVILWLQQLAQIIFFFHPAIWLVGRELKRERELACDELVLAVPGISPKDYAAGYVAALRLVTRSATAIPVSLGMAEPLEIEKRRLQMIFSGYRQLRRRWLAGVALVAALGLPWSAGVSERHAVQVAQAPSAATNADASGAVGQPSAAAIDPEPGAAVSNTPVPEFAPSGLILTPGVYRSKWIIPTSSDDGVSYIPNLQATFPKDARQRAAGIPRLKSAEPVFGVLAPDGGKPEFDKTSLLFALDESRGTGRGCDTLYLDINMNGDLRDDRAITGSVVTGPSNSKWVKFSNAGSIPYNKMFPDSSNSGLAALGVEMRIENGKVSYGEAWRKGCWQVEVDSSRGKIPIRLLDNNGNGRYSDEWSLMGIATMISSTSTPRIIGDAMLMDLHGKGRFEESWLVFKEPRYPVSRAVSVDGHLYSMKPTAAGDALEVRAYEGPTARLAVKILPVGKTEMRLRHAAVVGSGTVFWLPEDGSSLEVPAGSYRVESVNIEPVSQDRNYRGLWLFDRRIIEASEGQTLVATFGGDIGLAISPDMPSLTLQRGGRRTRFDVRVTLSKGGEVSIWNSGNGDGADVTILDPAGTPVLKAHGFGGWGGSRQFSVDLPASLQPGPYKIKATFDAQPYGGMVESVRDVAVE